MANFRTYSDNDCIIIEDDDNYDIENTHNSKYIGIDKSSTVDNVKDNDVEIVFESPSAARVLNINNDHNHRKRAHPTLNDNSNFSKKITVVDLTEDNDEFDHHISFRRKIVKDYPGLCVDVSSGLYSYQKQSEDEKRRKLNELEENMNKVITTSIGNLEVWLIKKNLILQTHYCDKHKNIDGSRVKMKLMQNKRSENQSIFKWIRSCCSSNGMIESLYYRGFFDKYPSPSLVLKIMYHWICISKPLSMAKVINVSLGCMNKLFFQIRAVCTAVIHEKFERLGGLKKVVEVCIFYVGVKERLKNTRKLKVIIVGAYDVLSKRKIIFALPPSTHFGNDGSTSLSPLTHFIDKESIIVTDQSVNKNLLMNVGFRNVFYSFHHNGSAVSNSSILKYTSNTLHIFDASLTYLAAEQIQLCLNELLWREKFGTHSSDAFNNLLTHISEVTKILENFISQRTLHSVLDEIIKNPYKIWRYSHLENNLPYQSIGREQCLMKPTTKESEIDTNISSISILQPYYYGTYLGDQQILMNEVERTTCINCHLCDEKFSKNDLFIEHCVKHALCKTDFHKIEVCTICLKSFSNKHKLTNHQASFHRVKPSETSCLICDEDFMYRSKLLEHMKNTHVELDLPYRCGICDYMCSERRNLTEHLIKQHNKSKKIWCPVCFKIFTLEQILNRFTDLNKFTKHIVRHIYKPFIEKCPKCTVHFIHGLVLKEHLGINHSTCKNKPGIKRYSSAVTERDTRIIRDRTQASALGLSHNSRLSKSILKMYSVSVQRIQTNNLTAGAECIECEGRLIYHQFLSQYHCKKCTFSTWCLQAINYHILESHIREYAKPSFVRFKNNTCSCACGYETKYGNKIAKHFAFCKFQLLKACSENVLNNDIVSSVILRKDVNIFQVQTTPSVLLSVGLISSRE